MSTNKTILANKKKDEIQMPNSLIFSPQNFSKLEKRLLYLSLLQLKNKQKPSEQLVLFDDYESFGGLSKSYDTPVLAWNLERTVNIPYSAVKNFGDWRQFKLAAKKLMCSKVELSYKSESGKNIEDVILLVERSKSEEGNGIRIQYTENGLQLLTHLSKSYSKLPLETVLSLNSKYSQRVHEILLSRCFGTNSGNWKVSLAEYRNLLGISSGTLLTHWGSLEVATLCKVQEELDKVECISKLIFNYRPIKSGNKVVEVEFEIKIINSEVQEKLKSSGLDLTETIILNELISLGVREDLRPTIINEHAKFFSKWNYARKLRKEPLINPAGHLLKTLGLV